EQAEPIEILLLGSLLCHRIEEQIHDIIGKRAADEKLHGEVVDTFRVFLLIRVLRMDPSLGKDIPYGSSESFKALTWTGRLQTDDVVEDEVPLVERIVRP